MPLPAVHVRAMSVYDGREGVQVLSVSRAGIAMECDCWFRACVIWYDRWKRRPVWWWHVSFGALR